MDTPLISLPFGGNEIAFEESEQYKGWIRVVLLRHGHRRPLGAEVNYILFGRLRRNLLRAKAERTGTWSWLLTLSEIHTCFYALVRPYRNTEIHLYDGDRGKFFCKQELSEHTFTTWIGILTDMADLASETAT